MRCIKKNDWHLFGVLDELYHHAKLGEDRTTRSGCSCENMVFVFFSLSRFVSGALFVRGANCLNKHCVRSLWVDFDSTFTVFFSEAITLSDELDSSHICC